MEYQATQILNMQAILGECPLWSAREQALYFLDILKPALYCFKPQKDELQEYRMPEDIGCIGLRKNGGFIAGMRSGIFLLDAQGQVKEKIADNPTDPKQSRFNDGKTDPWGHFWCGTIWEKDKEQKAKICRIEKDNLKFKTIIENLNNSNGIAFSPDKKWLYYTDTSANSLYKVPLDYQTGNPLAETTLVYHFGTGQPDGATFDTSGNYWSAQYGDGLVLCLSPAGEIIHKVKVPAKQVTMVTFGGQDLQTLFITTAKENLTVEELQKDPQAGNLFAVKVKNQGLPEPYFWG